MAAICPLTSTPCRTGVPSDRNASIAVGTAPSGRAAAKAPAGASDGRSTVGTSMLAPSSNVIVTVETSDGTGPHTMSGSPAVSTYQSVPVASWSGFAGRTPMALPSDSSSSRSTPLSVAVSRHVSPATVPDAISMRPGGGSQSSSPDASTRPCASRARASAGRTPGGSPRPNHATRSSVGTVTGHPDTVSPWSVVTSTVAVSRGISPYTIPPCSLTPALSENAPWFTSGARESTSSCVPPAGTPSTTTDVPTWGGSPNTRTSQPLPPAPVGPDAITPSSATRAVHSAAGGSPTAEDSVVASSSSSARSSPAARVRPPAAAARTVTDAAAPTSTSRRRGPWASPRTRARSGASVAGTAIASPNEVSRRRAAASSRGSRSGFIVEHLSQVGEAPMQQRRDGARAAGQQPGDLVDRQVLVVTEDDRGPPPLGQAGENGPQVVVFGRLDVPRGRGQRATADQGEPAAVVAAAIDHRRPQVAGRGVEPVPAPGDLEERVLDDLLGDRQVTHQERRQAHGGIASFPEEVLDATVSGRRRIEP